MSRPTANKRPTRSNGDFWDSAAISWYSGSVSVGPLRAIATQGMKHPALRSLASVFLVLCVLSLQARADVVARFLANHCSDCHTGEDANASVRLDDIQSLDWNEHETEAFYERILKAVRTEHMPPEDTDQPAAGERKEFVDALHHMLVERSGTGGTVLRRLNRSEYENSIRSIFGIDFSVPTGFPNDTTADGFDNSGEGLVFSGPLLDAWFESAITVADQVIPPEPAPQPLTRTQIGPQDLVISYSSGLVLDNALRMACKTNVLFRGTTWPAKFEVRTPGR